MTINLVKYIYLAYLYLMHMNNRVELRHLRYFICVADEMHFGRAAERLGIAQAPLSQQIKQLEERVGVQLFERTTRSVRLTKGGEVFREKALLALENVESGIEAACLVMGEARRKLTIGCVSPTVFTCLPGILRLFREKCPDTRIDIRTLSTDESLDAMADGRIDVAFIRPPRSKANINIEHLFSEEFVALVPKGDVLAAKRSLSLSDFEGLPYIAYAPVLGISYQDVVMQHARDTDVSINIVEEVGNTLGIVALVAAGFGVGVAPRWVADMPHPDVSYIPMPELPADAVTLAIAWPFDSKSPVIADFVTCARNFIAGA